MEARVVVLVPVRAEDGLKGGVGVLHVDYFLLNTLLEERKEGSSDPVHAKDIDGETLGEIIPINVSRYYSLMLWAERERNMDCTPSAAYWQTPALLIKTSSPLPASSASTSAAAFSTDASLVTSS